MSTWGEALQFVKNGIVLLVVGTLAVSLIGAKSVAMALAIGVLAILSVSAGMAFAHDQIDVEHQRFEEGLKHLKHVLEWLSDHHLQAESQVSSVEDILAPTAGVAFQARNNRISQAHTSGMPVSLEATDLACVSDLLAKCTGDDIEDALVYLVTLDTLFMGFYVSEETYRVQGGAYARFTSLMRNFLKDHSSMLTTHMRRTLGYIAEDLEDVGLGSVVGSLKDDLCAAGAMARRTRQLMRLRLVPNERI
jgi:hypothetical protein